MIPHPALAVFAEDGALDEPSMRRLHLLVEFLKRRLDIRQLDQIRKENGIYDLSQPFRTEHNGMIVATALHFACIRGDDLALVRYLVEGRGADVHARCCLGGTPMFWACVEGHLEVVQYLVDERGVDLDGPEAEVGEPHALLQSSSELTQFCDHFTGMTLLEIARECPGRSAVTPFILEKLEVRMQAAEETIYTACKRLAESGELANESSERWSLLMHYRCGSTNLAGLEEARIRSPALDLAIPFETQEGKTLATTLHIACVLDERALVKYLVEARRADVEACCVMGLPAVAWAKAGDREHIYQYLLMWAGDRDDIVSELFRASERGLSCLQNLVDERGINLDTQTAKDGMAAIHVVAKEGSLNAVRHLVQAGASLNLTTEHGRTALHLACLNGRHKIVEYLCADPNVDLSIEDNEGLTAVHIAALNGRVPLHLACAKGHTDVTRLLLERGVDTNVQDNDGWAAIHISAAGGYVDVLQCLVASGADVSLQGARGMTALHVACEHGHLSAVKYLCAGAQADVDSVDDDSNSPLLSAMRFGKFNETRMEIVRYLIEEAEADYLGFLGEGADHRDDRPRIPAFLIARLTNDIDLLRYMTSLNDDEGRTTAHLAALRGHTEVMRDSPLVCAMQSPKFDESRMEIVRYLIEEAGADYLGFMGDSCHQDRRARTPAFLAACLTDNIDLLT
eukprot:g2065.t1